MPDFNNRWIEIATHSEKVLNRMRAIRQNNPSLSFEQVLSQAQQECEAGARFTEGVNSMFDPDSVKLNKRAEEIARENPQITFGEALRKARREGRPEFAEGTAIPESIKLNARAMQISANNPKLQFGEALRRARREGA